MMSGVSQSFFTFISLLSHSLPLHLGIKICNKRGQAEAASLCLLADSFILLHLLRYHCKWQRCKWPAAWLLL